LFSFNGKTLSLHAKVQGDTVAIMISGTMNVKSIAFIEPLLKQLLTHPLPSQTFEWHLQEVTHFDSAAALLLYTFDKKAQSLGATCKFYAQTNHQNIIDAVYHRHYESGGVMERRLNAVATIGKTAVTKYHGFKDFLAFVGELFAALLIYILNPKSIRFKEIYAAIEESSINALGIIALTTFLIGVVLAYQSAIQLKTYGANIFIVDMLGISVLRELAPLIAAIVIAGRSGSAFAAQIGVMKITEELDAMKTMGFDPYLFLVLPRIIALMIMMPLIIFFADVMAMLGGMVVASIELGISAELFLDRFNEAVAMKHFFIGISKGPFFGFLIAAIGIFRGLMVENDTRSIGVNTTKSVVEAIFMVIICDAIFSIIYTNIGI